jgi:hypothetical protein
MTSFYMNNNALGQKGAIIIKQTKKNIGQQRKTIEIK